MPAASLKKHELPLDYEKANCGSSSVSNDRDITDEWDALGVRADLLPRHPVHFYGAFLWR
ncbi:hypothetical protein N7449_010081 [Penicillium cf. viridicatum]|uniref:Uncharacterized protein n=1 Tax=Penicillium cf. viridicatum TaxID=2972119 RepID=A0A9W9M4L8_9EURO|nr:hypothetical protein N7449_010081 [Penicillium cf. viridicatum]